MRVRLKDEMMKEGNEERKGGGQRVKEPNLTKIRR